MKLRGFGIVEIVSLALNTKNKGDLLRSAGSMAVRFMEFFFGEQWSCSEMLFGLQGAQPGVAVLLGRLGFVHRLVGSLNYVGADCFCVFVREFLGKGDHSSWLQKAI